MPECIRLHNSSKATPLACKGHFSGGSPRAGGEAPVKTILVVFFSLVAASIFSHQGGVDLILSRAIYAMEGGSQGFAWKDNFWLERVLHSGGRSLVKRCFFIALGLWVTSRWVDSLKPWRPAFLYVVIAVIASTTLVSCLKQLTTIPCPQALVEFGGDKNWVDIWQLFSPELPRGHCYPAGHASGGYAWFCIAFIFPYQSRGFFLGLLPGLFLGLGFGVAQQLRGSHFLSHDLLTAALSWLTAGLLAHVFQQLVCNEPQTACHPEIQK